MSPIELVRSRLEGVSSDGRSARCPAHDDRRASLSIGEGDDGKVLLQCFAGCDFEKIVAAMGLEMRDLWPSANGRGERRIVAIYDYTDENGELLSQVVRFSPKDFRQRRPDPASPNGWTWKLGSTRRVLYRLPALAASSEQGVFVVEGEKDADALAHRGLVATTNPGGAGQWRSDFNKSLEGRRVSIIPDNDETGEKHAEHVVRELRGIAAAVRLVRLPGLPEKGDVSDWLDAGETVDALKRLVAETKPEAEIHKEVGIRLSDVTPERAQWLWRARIPFGKPTICDGDPGLGKSTLFLEIAARLSRGEPLPGDDERREPAGVVILSAEDGLADTIRPRLEAAGANLERIIAIVEIPLPGGGEDFPEIPRDLSMVEAAMKRVGARLVIVDPMMAYLGDDVASHRDQGVRRALAPLARLAEKTGAAVVVLRHLKKGPRGTRSIGAGAPSGSARHGRHSSSRRTPMMRIGGS